MSYASNLKRVVSILFPYMGYITDQCCFSIPSENITKPRGFLMFSGGIEKQNRAVMG